MKAYYTNQIQIDTSMCDASGKLGLWNAFTLFQDAASRHAENLGVGFEAMGERKSFWVTVRTRVHFHNRPGIMQKVDISTWPAAPGNTRCDRSYQISRNGEILVEGRTEWCVVDTEKGSVKPISEAGFAEDIEYLDELVLPAPYARFKHNFADEDCALKYTVQTTDIDVGHHMNNVAYLRALLNSFTVEELENMNVSEMEIMFCMPCFEGNQLDILRRKTDYGYEFGVRRPDGRYAALAQMKAEAK